jgi:hypothetical protein
MKDFDKNWRVFKKSEYKISEIFIQHSHYWAFTPLCVTISETVKPKRKSVYDKIFIFFGGGGARVRNIEKSNY